METEDLKYVLETLEYALNECPVKDDDHETHFNTFANAIELIKNELASFRDNRRELLIRCVRTCLKDKDSITVEQQVDNFLFLNSDG